MGCNCKRARLLQQKAERENEPILTKLFRYFLKFVMLLITIGLSVVLVPILFVVAVYKVIFGDMTTPLVLPKFVK